MLKKSRTVRENATNLLVILGMLFVAFGCVCKDLNNNSGGGNIPSSNTSINPSSNTNSSANSSAKKPSKKGDTKAETTRKSEVADNGDFQVEYVDVQDQRYSKLNNELRQEKVLEAAAKDLNKALALPHDITLVTRDCGQVNAFYNPNDRSVTLCYELLDHFYGLFKKAGRSDQEATQDMFDAAQFVFLHEIGHAVIDAHKIPIAGREEDAADGLSTFINLEELKDNGARATIAAADLFYIQGKMSGGKDLPFYDEHSLDQQRFYNLLCSLYGSNPSKYGGIVSKGLLPEARAVRCTAEYEQMKRTWTDLLAKYRKQ